MKVGSIIEFQHIGQKQDEKLGLVTVTMNVGIDLEDIDSWSVEDSTWTELVEQDDESPAVAVEKTSRSLTLVMKKTYKDFVTINVPRIVGKGKDERIEYSHQIDVRDVPIQHTVYGDTIDVIVDQIHALKN